MTHKVPLWLLANPELVRGHSRALALAARHQPINQCWSLILEGGPGHLQAPSSACNNLRLHQLAGQCLCCVGQLPLRVTLARILRLEKPARLVLEMAHIEHLQQVTTLLTQGAFSEHLLLEPSPPSD